MVVNMLNKLTEFNNELTELGEVISKIEALPSDLQDLMMDKFKNTVLEEDNEPIQQEDRAIEPEKNQEGTSIDKILAVLPELTQKEAEEQVQEIRRRYISAPSHRKIEILNEIPSIHGITRKTGVHYNTVQNCLNYNKYAPVRTGDVARIRLIESSKNSPVFYYIPKNKEESVNNNCSEIKPFKEYYTKPSIPYSQSKPYVVSKNGCPYTTHTTKEERDKAYSIGEKTGWDKARMYNLPNYVIYDGKNTYSIFIPKTNKLLREKITLKDAKGFVDWINEAKDYNGGAKVNFDSYFNVYFNRTSKGLPSWQYKQHQPNKRDKRISGRTLEKLRENMSKQGLTLSKSFGDYTIDLTHFLE